MCELSENEILQIINDDPSSNLDEESLRHDALVELAQAAVKQNGLTLRHVPWHMRHDDLCLAAVQQNGLALEFVPEKQRDHEICITAVQQNGLALRNVPKKERCDHELCLAAVQQNGMALQFVPEAYHYNREICLAAVQQNGFALQYVPRELWDQEMRLAAHGNLETLLEVVPDDMRAYVEHQISEIRRDMDALLLLDALDDQDRERSL